MAKQFNQSTLDELAGVLGIQDNTATSIMQSLIALLLYRAQGLQEDYSELEEESGVLIDSVVALYEDIEALTDQRDEAREIVNQRTYERDKARVTATILHKLAALALVAFNRELFGASAEALESREALYSFLDDQPEWVRAMSHS